MLWEVSGGKVEASETKDQALISECIEGLNVILNVEVVFMEVVHEYTDIIVHLTLFKVAIIEGESQLLEHNYMRWIIVSEIPQYGFCPVDMAILKRSLKPRVCDSISANFS